MKLFDIRKIRTGSNIFATENVAAVAAEVDVEDFDDEVLDDVGDVEVMVDVAAVVLEIESSIQCSNLV